MLLHRSGSGDPAVVFLVGGGAVGLDYLNLQQRAAELATSVIFDRAGTGWSQRVDLPRASAEVIEELRALLTAAEVPLPICWSVTLWAASTHVTTSSSILAMIPA